MGYKRVIKHYPNGGVEQDDEIILVKEFDTNAGSVTAEYAARLQLVEPKYSSVEIRCSVTLPCYQEEVPAALKLAWEIAMDEVVKQIKNSALKQEIRTASSV